MAVTFTDNYRDVLAPETVKYIDSLTEADYCLEDMLVFIDEHSEESFMENYPTYVELGEEYGYDPVDAFLKLADDPSDLRYFADAYIGRYLNARDMAADYFEYETERLDYRIVIDYEETAEYLLQHEVDCVDYYYFRHDCY